MVWLKYIFFLVVSFLIFSIPLSNRPLFYYAHDAFSPLLKNLYSYIKSDLDNPLDKGKKIILKSVPSKI